MAAGKENTGREAKAVKRTVSSRRTSGKAIAKETVITAPAEAVTKAIVYQKSAQILERDAEPNEQFALGDAMPIYYL